MTKIKICGIKNAESALAAAEAGADFIGLVFAPSPRQVTPAQAKIIVEAMKQNAGASKIVGVFVNTPPQTVNSAAEACALDYVQLNGDETLEYCRAIKPAIIRAIRINNLQKPEQVIYSLTIWNQALSGHDHIFLLDAYSPDKYGGTGNMINIDTAASISEKFQVILAGGLNPHNVFATIKKIKPWGVDVSSGVETKGEKDVKKIKAFIKAAKEAG